MPFFILIASSRCDDSLMPNKYAVYGMGKEKFAMVRQPGPMLTSRFQLSMQNVTGIPNDVTSKQFQFKIQGQKCVR